MLPPHLELLVTQTLAAVEVPRNQILEAAIRGAAILVEATLVEATLVEATLVEATPVEATPVEATPVGPRPAGTIPAYAIRVTTIRAGTGAAAAIPVAGIPVTAMPAGEILGRLDPATTIQQVGISPRIRVMERARPIPKDSRTMVSTWRRSMYRKTSEFLWKTSAQK